MTGHMILTSDSQFEPLGTRYRIRDKRTVFVSDIRALAQPRALQSGLRCHPDESNGSLFPLLTPLFLITYSKSRRIRRSRSVVSWGDGACLRNPTRKCGLHPWGKKVRGPPWKFGCSDSTRASVHHLRYPPCFYHTVRLPVRSFAKRVSLALCYGDMAGADMLRYTLNVRHHYDHWFAGVCGPLF